MRLPFERVARDPRVLAKIRGDYIRAFGLIPATPDAQIGEHEVISFLLFNLDELKSTPWISTRPPFPVSSPARRGIHPGSRCHRLTRVDKLRRLAPYGDVTAFQRLTRTYPRDRTKQVNRRDHNEQRRRCGFRCRNLEPNPSTRSGHF